MKPKLARVSGAIFYAYLARDFCLPEPPTSSSGRSELSGVRTTYVHITLKVRRFRVLAAATFTKVEQILQGF